jgi:signal peptidase I
LLGVLAVVSSGLWLAVSKHDPGSFWPAVVFLLTVPWMRFFSVDRELPSANPFNSLRRKHVAEQEADVPRRMWVENVVGLVSALVFLVLSYTYFVEAFRIPTGSMEPTLFGDPVLGDRAMVDKQTYQFTDPKRGDIAVFRFPQNRSQPYVKRVAGLPGESLLILNGDLWVVTDHAKGLIRPWQKHVDIGDAGWLRLLTFEGGDASYGLHFKGLKGKAQAADGVITLDATGEPSEFRYPRDGSIRNHFPIDGQPRPGMPYDTEAVGDVRVSFDMEADAGAELLVTIHRSDSGPLEFRCSTESQESLTFRMDGDGEKWQWVRGTGERGHFSFGLADGVVVTPGQQPIPADRRQADCIPALRWPFDAVIAKRREAGHAPELNDPSVLLDLANAVSKLEACHITFTATGGKIAISNLKIDRDFHYLGRFPIQEGQAPDGSRVWQREQARSMPMAFHLPDDQYLMLGDHTEDSADSRAWILVEASLQDGSTVRFPIEEMISMSARAGRGGAERWYGRVYASVMGLANGESPGVVATSILDGVRIGDFGQRLGFTDVQGIARAIDTHEVKSVRVTHAPGVQRGLIDGKLVGSLFPRPRFVR